MEEAGMVYYYNENNDDLITYFDEMGGAENPERAGREYGKAKRSGFWRPLAWAKQRTIFRGSILACRKPKVPRILAGQV